jgi:spore maturation protein CgeB
MKIAFFGSSLVSAYWNGAATYYRGIVRALASRGHEITFFEPDAYERQKHRDMLDPEWAEIVVYPATCDEDALVALDRARDADLIVKASGIGVFDALLEREVTRLRRPGNLIAFWDVDAPATLDRMHADVNDPFRALVGAYDVVFTYGGGEPVRSAYERLGARTCVPIYNALDPDTHYPVPPEVRFNADIGFLANRLPDREARVEEFFLKAAALLPRRNFLLGGNGWASKKLPRNVRSVGHVYTRDHNAFHGTPLAALNVNRESMARYGFSPATRVFEAAGAAACLITDAFEGLEQFLDPGTEVLVATCGEDVAQHLGRLDRDRAQRIGEAARRRVLARHTYAHRAALVEYTLEGAAQASREARP